MLSSVSLTGDTSSVTWQQQGTIARLLVLQNFEQKSSKNLKRLRNKTNFDLTCMFDGMVHLIFVYVYHFVRKISN